VAAAPAGAGGEGRGQGEQVTGGGTLQDQWATVDVGAGPRVVSSSCPASLDRAIRWQEAMETLGRQLSDRDRLVMR
jgi:hypothetical protein